jgi:hypothetical protein
MVAAEAITELVRETAMLAVRPSQNRNVKLRDIAAQLVGRARSTSAPG